jgi:nitrile hydratase subunit beta
VGDRVRARNIHPPTHTRLPRYVRGRVGTVVLVHGAHIYPDVHAHGGGEDPQWLYTVRFDGRELWGPDADPKSGVSVDAFEPYLEPAA